MATRTKSAAGSARTKKSTVKNAARARPRRARSGTKPGVAGLAQIRHQQKPVRPDVPDVLDRLYEPTLLPLPAARPPPKKPTILDQGDEGACTGFALAAAIHHLLDVNPATRNSKRKVSPQMLYRMARRHDEWPGEKDEGSSLRGALRGFYNCGVCSDEVWDTELDDVTLDSARDARLTTLGAYYRLRPNLSDYHAAINETGVIYVSATVHEGWADPKDGRIKPGEEEAGGHAFVIVGYNKEGFWIQNSWGEKWGKGGLALWEYSDWARSVTDAWVLQLAVSAPKAFGLGFSRGGGTTAVDVSRLRRSKPNRQEIAGHFVHLNNGCYSNDAPYWSSAADVAATAQAIAASDKQHFLFYAHGGLNSPEDAAVRTAAMLDGFARNGIYPYNVFYDTGLARTLKDIIERQADKLLGRTGGFTDFLDGLIEKAIGPVGKSLWREMKRDACLPFEADNDGTEALKAFLQAFSQRKQKLSLHMAGHSTGGVLIGHLLDALERIAKGPITIDSVSLMAPACSVDFYREHYRPYLLGMSATGQPTRVRLKQLNIYNLNDAAELDDNTGKVYRKSLLYLVSKAFEEKPEAPLLGMQIGISPETDKTKKKRPAPDSILGDKGLTVYYTDDDSGIPKATSHGGFDNDKDTMNHVLKTILGKTPAKPFTKDELDYGGA